MNILDTPISYLGKNQVIKSKEIIHNQMLFHNIYQ